MLGQRRDLLVRAVCIVLLLSLVQLNVESAAAYGHVNDFWAVDDGKAIDYKDHTDYPISSSLSAWNVEGSPTWRLDGITSLTDLKFWDYNDDTDNRFAYYRYLNRGRSDSINFNDYKMGPATATKQRRVAGHEMGHALGLDEHDPSVYTACQSIMAAQVTSSCETPRPHDIADYDTLCAFESAATGTGFTRRQLRGYGT